MEFSKEQLEQIRAVFDNHPSVIVGAGCGSVADIRNWLIAELTNKWIPVDGEVCYDLSHDRFVQFASGPDANWDNLMPLTVDNVPAWERDKAALKVAIEFIKDHFNPLTDSREKTLAKIKELTGW